MFKMHFLNLGLNDKHHLNYWGMLQWKDDYLYKSIYSFQLIANDKIEIGQINQSHYNNNQYYSISLLSKDYFLNTANQSSLRNLNST